jgi:hypothetical protein
MMSEGDAVRSMEARERIAEAREQELGIFERRIADSEFGVGISLVKLFTLAGVVALAIMGIVGCL